MKFSKVTFQPVNTQGDRLPAIEALAAFGVAYHKRVGSPGGSYSVSLVACGATVGHTVTAAAARTLAERFVVEARKNGFNIDNPDLNALQTAVRTDRSKWQAFVQARIHYSVK